MLRRKRTLFCAVFAVCLAVLTYVPFRLQARRSAHRDIVAFFQNYQQGEDNLVAKELKNLAQPHDVADRIMSRHRNALMNFNYSTLRPSLNLMLNRTVVGVSWDLSIVFYRQADGWRVLSFDEFVHNKA